MSELADKTETGSTLMIIGLALWVTALLVVFFLPAAVKVGHHGTFAWLLSILLVLAGVALMARGLRLRGREE